MAKSSFKLEFLFSKCFYKIASSSIISTGISTAAVHSCSSCCLHNNIDERREANFLLLSSAIRTSHIKKASLPCPHQTQKPAYKILSYQIFLKASNHCLDEDWHPMDPSLQTKSLNCIQRNTTQSNHPA